MHPVLRATERDLRFFALTWRGVVISQFVAPVLLLLAMGVGLGGLVEEDTASLDGVDYLSFVTPGLLVATATQTAGAAAMWPVMAGHRWIGFNRAMVATPLRPIDVFGGYQVWMALRGAASAVVFLLAGVALGGVSSWWSPLAVIAGAMTVVAFSAPIAAYATWTETDLAFDPIMRIVITPLYLFSGTFFPLAELPVGLQWLAKAFPLWHGVELARSATSGHWPAIDTITHLGVLVAFIVGGFVFGRWATTRRLTS